VLVPTQAIDEAWRGGSDFDDSAWQAGTGGVGYESSTGYEQFFDIDVQDAMYGQNAGCYIRIPFEVPETDYEDVSSLVLKVRYDDGFIAYLNGTEVQRVLFSGEPMWNSGAGANHSDIDAIELETFNLSESIAALRPGQNILAIHGLNAGATSSDFLISVELTGATGLVGGLGGGVSAGAILYTGPVTLDVSSQVNARTSSGATWSALSQTIFSVGPVPENLRISEIMYHPADPNAEYIELTNIGAETINLSLVTFADGVEFTFPGAELAPGDYLLVVRDVAAFEAEYGAGFAVVGQYAGSLSNAGERIVLQDAVGRVIHDFRFRDNWFDMTDGLGFSLAARDPAMTDPNAWGGKSAWRPSAAAGGSPGFDDTGDVPNLGTVVINEILANPGAGQSDWIELRNTTDQPVNIGRWFMSDDVGSLMKYEIAAGTVIPPDGYVVFYADEHFANEDNPGCHEPFALSRNGETVYLHSGADGALTGYSEEEKFDASEAGVSLGRYRKSTGTHNFVALREPTPGAANAEPAVGPVVITEIMYNPGTSPDAEYVELLNVSDDPVTLYDEALDAPWRFTDDPDDPGIEFLFPADEKVTLAPGEYLVVAKNLDAFAGAYTVPAGVPTLEWGNGRLSNGGDKVQISKPGNDAGDDARYWIRVDRVVYGDGSHPDDFPTGVDPWPTEADGQGQALTRISPAEYGNDPVNWQAAEPSPGLLN
jgi:hypothetical protein